MSDKKTDDPYPQGTANNDSFAGEKDRFINSSPSFSTRSAAPMQVPETISKLNNSPGVSVLAYCLASISMTVVNKYVVSGNWNLTFLYLAIQVRLHTSHTMST